MAAQQFAAVVGANDVNFVQQAYYDRHDWFHGAKKYSILCRQILWCWALFALSTGMILPL